MLNQHLSLSYDFKVNKQGLTGPPPGLNARQKKAGGRKK